MADMDGIFQVEMRRKSRQVVGVMIHIMAVGSLGRAAVSTAIMGDKHGSRSRDAGRTTSGYPSCPR
jgi:hypothetical protein